MLNPKFGELSEWLKEHAWKVCVRQRTESSNLSLTATFLKKDVLGRLFLCLKITKTNKGNFLSDHNGCSIIESQETLKQATPEANNYESAVLSYCMTPKNRE